MQVAKMTRSHLTIFLIFTSVYLVSIFFNPYPLSWILKLIPIIVLLHFSWKRTGETKESAHKLFIIGLGFSAIGDFLLAYDPVNWFVLGLGSFLVAHIFYIFSLKPILPKAGIIKRLPIVALYCLYGVSMFSFIYAGLGELFIPVFVYMTVLLVMGVTTLLSHKSNKWLIIGGISFIVSDSLIGLDKFYQEIPFASLLIMVTYYLAQFSLVKGLFETNTRLKTAATANS
jgi:alkenylglycerophosphocholine/alkenylglycerophosphoethanolamine hydrolase